ncbi:MAG: transposase [Rhodobacterales bacterium]|nr:transposase [Rhodobacterales bacterium]
MKVDGQLTALAKSDPVTRLLMTMPGVDVIVALSFRSAVDDPDRFPRYRDVDAWFGLTPRRWQSGKTDIVGRIAKAGDARVRTMLLKLPPVFLAVSASCRRSNSGASGSQREPA